LLSTRNESPEAREELNSLRQRCIAHQIRNAPMPCGTRPVQISAILDADQIRHCRRLKRVRPVAREHSRRYRFMGGQNLLHRALLQPMLHIRIPLHGKQPQPIVAYLAWLPPTPLPECNRPIEGEVALRSLRHRPVRQYARVTETTGQVPNLDIPGAAYDVAYPGNGTVLRDWHAGGGIPGSTGDFVHVDFCVVHRRSIEYDLTRADPVLFGIEARGIEGEFRR